MDTAVIQHDGTCMCPPSVWDCLCAVCFPEGWQAIGEKCYLIGDTNQNWFAARQFCAHNDGHLDEFDAEDDLLELLPFFYEGDVYSYDYWFGLNDLIEDNAWIYDHTLMSHPNTNYDTISKFVIILKGKCILREY